KTVLEEKPLEQLARQGQLMAYKHDDFWQCMDTVRDKNRLEELWRTNHAPWKTSASCPTNFSKVKGISSPAIPPSKVRRSPLGSRKCELKSPASHCRPKPNATTSSRLIWFDELTTTKVTYAIMRKFIARFKTLRRKLFFILPRNPSSGFRTPSLS